MSTEELGFGVTQFKAHLFSQVRLFTKSLVIFLNHTATPSWLFVVLAANNTSNQRIVRARIEGSS